jgi:hypothetical protein
LIQFPAIASGASFAGTCLMHTMMFTEFFPHRFQSKVAARAEGDAIYRTTA